MISTITRRTQVILPSISKAFIFSTCILAASQTLAKRDTCFAMSTVPDRMIMTSTMGAQDISKTKLLPLDLSENNGEVTVTEQSAKAASAIISQTSGVHGSIAFVVRRPG